MTRSSWGLDTEPATIHLDPDKIAAQDCGVPRSDTAQRECPAVRHGTPTAYRGLNGCRCPEAREAMRPIWSASREKRRVAKGGPLVRGIPARWIEVDEVAVARAIAGEPPARLSPAEKTAAVRVLTDRGMSAKAIGRRLRMSTRQVVRHRSGQIKSYWMREAA